jgi:hypothetical protein
MPGAVMKVYVAGIGVLGPGLQGWAKSAAILRGESPYVAEPLVLEAPAILSSRERRRSSPTIRLALNAAQEAVDQAGIAPEDLATVFGSSCGNGREIHLLLEALATPEMLVSPTQFHNSVHNAAVGYWCIATSCHLPSTSIACHDYTFAASLLKAAAQVVSENCPVLLTVFDDPFPAPLNGTRPISAPFAVGLVLTPTAGPEAKVAMSVSWLGGAPTETIAAPGSPGLAALWQGNPAGRALPLLAALAQGGAATVRLTYPDHGHLELALAPC